MSNEQQPYEDGLYGRNKNQNRNETETKRNETRRTVCVCDVRPEVLLQVGVLVVVDAHEPVTRPLSQVLHQARLTARRGTLQ